MRNIGLDLLRVLAVLLVIGRHLHLPKECPSILRRIAEGGWIGVDIFFVLSGFLVSSLLFCEYKRNGFVDVRRFLIRRGFKIYPPFWLFLAFTLVVRQCAGMTTETSQIIGELLFVQNYVGGVWTHTWSLAVEEHFYLAIALLVWGMVAVNSSKPFRYVPAIFGVLAVTCLIFRILNLAIYTEFSHRACLFGTHIRIDSLMFGVFVAYLWNFRELRNRTACVPSVVLVATAILLLSPAFMFQLETNKWLSVVGVILFYLGAGVLLVAALRWEKSDSRCVRFAAGFGAASYSIYLWHIPIAAWGNKVFTKVLGYDHYGIYLVNAVIGAFVFGWAMSRLVEHPMLKLRDRLVSARSDVTLKEVA